MSAVPISAFAEPCLVRWPLAVLTTLAAFAIWLTAAIADPAHTDTGDIALPKGVHIDSLILPDGASGSATVGFGVNRDGLPVVADGTQLRILGEGQAILDIAPRKIDDFSWMLGAQLLLISGDRLISPGPNGQLRELALSATGMKVRRAGDDDAYVFGGAAEPANHDVFLVKPSGAMIKLATLPSPISDVSGFGTNCYVAIGKRLLHLAEGETVAIVLEAPSDITSIMAVRQWRGLLRHAGRGELRQSARLDVSVPAGIHRHCARRRPFALCLECNRTPATSGPEYWHS